VIILSKFLRYVIFYKWSVDTFFLTGTATAIFGCKGPMSITTFEFLTRICLFTVYNFYGALMTIKGRLQLKIL